MFNDLLSDHPAQTKQTSNSPVSTGLKLSIPDSTSVAAAGEYYVLSRLCLHGKIAALAPSGVRNADIVITSVDGERLHALQVVEASAKIRVG